jgi:glycosyltransferase involved in cell wall biosynthesis
MKSLLISPQYPLPEDNGGKMRTMNFVRFFERYGTVDLVYFVPKLQEFQGSPFRKETFFNLIEREEKNAGFVSDLEDRIRRLLERRPRAVRYFPKKAENEFLTFILEDNYDVILCRYILHTFLLFKLPKEVRKRIIIDFDDILSDSLYEVDMGGKSGIVAKVKRKIDRRFLVQYEKKCLDFGAACFCSNEDLNKIECGEGRKWFVVPNTYPVTWLSHVSLGDGYGKRNKLLFVGALGYGPNREGLEWFIDSIFPYVRERFPNSKLIIVGREPSERIINACQDSPYFELHTSAPCVEPYYRDCGITVVPLLSGGGTRIKILEAGHAGRPVLSTPLGAYGLEVENGRDLLLFTDEDSFLSQLKSLDNKKNYDSLVENLRTVVTDKYSANSFNKAMDLLISQLE